MWHHGGLKMLFEEWNQLLADPGARSRSVAIAGIFAPRLFDRSQVSTQIVAPRLKKRPERVT